LQGNAEKNKVERRRKKRIGLCLIGVVNKERNKDKRKKEGD